MGIDHWYNLMTSNNVESLNALFKKDRELPILAMMENIRTAVVLSRLTYEITNCMSVLAIAQEDKLFKAADVARKLIVEPLDKSRFSIQCTHHVAYMVDLTNNICTCTGFHLESFPYEHAVAIAMNRGFAARTLCSTYYKANYWRAVYAETIFSLLNEADLEVTDHILPLNSLSPPLVEPCGPGVHKLLEYPLLESFLDRVGAADVEQSAILTNRQMASMSFTIMPSWVAIKGTIIESGSKLCSS